MSNFNDQNNFQVKNSKNISVFNAVLAEFSKLYNIKADKCTKFVHAGLAILFGATKAAPYYVRVSRGSHPGQHRIQR